MGISPTTIVFLSVKIDNYSFMVYTGFHQKRNRNAYCWKNLSDSFDSNDELPILKIIGAELNVDISKELEKMATKFTVLHTLNIAGKPAVMVKDESNEVYPIMENSHVFRESILIE